MRVSLVARDAGNAVGSVQTCMLDTCLLGVDIEIPVNLATLAVLALQPVIRVFEMRVVKLPTLAHGQPRDA